MPAVQMQKPSTYFFTCSKGSLCWPLSSPKLALLVSLSALALSLLLKPTRNVQTDSED